MIDQTQMPLKVKRLHFRVAKLTMEKIEAEEELEDVVAVSDIYSNISHMICCVRGFLYKLCILYNFVI